MANDRRKLGRVRKKNQAAIHLKTTMRVTDEIKDAIDALRTGRQEALGDKLASLLNELIQWRINGIKVDAEFKEFINFEKHPLETEYQTLRRILDGHEARFQEQRKNAEALEQELQQYKQPSVINRYVE